ncbi:MAG: uracil-DNA glycosylase [Bacteroidaceae bacterium]|nr:uracil-DNA glycosylase [Bacteroidaceae bacterium]
MYVKIDPSWHAILSEEFDKDYFRQLTDFVRAEYRQTTCYPPGSLIFNAFNLCPFTNTKVVILGQDPYHEPGQAMGLCFSVPEGVKVPPSLVNIYKELGVEGRSGDLTAWAKQGVLLLNATLTVRQHQAGSHQRRGWETFTDAVIKHISDSKDHVVFILWGSYAISKAQLIDRQKHLVLTSVHPSPLSAHRGFFGNHHFELCNDFLSKHAITPIAW